MTSKRFDTPAAITLLMLLNGAASAQNWPLKPVRIVTSEAGGGNDVPARIVALGLTQAFGQQFIVENRPSGVVPADTVAKASPDGYTLLLYNNALWTAPLIQTTPYDATRDFAPVIEVARAVNVLVVNPASPAKSVAELIALARARPDTFNYGSSGTGASNHLAAEMFKSMAHVDLVRINYKGASPALTALIAGELQLMFPTAGAVIPHIRAARVRALAITGARPTPLLPGVPTVAATLPGYESIAIYGLFAPAATPTDIIAKLNAQLAQYLRRSDVKERLSAAGLDATGGTASSLAAGVRAEVTRTTQIITEAGIKGD